jgi:hypothetical protein
LDSEFVAEEYAVWGGLVAKLPVEEPGNILRADGGAERVVETGV